MIPTTVTLITGFLGAGKTTFINRLLQLEDLSDTVVMVNEFGEVGLDHLLVEGADDTVLELSNGCICCSVRGELVDGLLDLMARKPKRIFIETTGIADPLPILQALAGHLVLSREISNVSLITIVDGKSGFETNGNHEEFLQQIALADRIFVSKLELIEPEDIRVAKATVFGQLRSVNSNADVRFLDADLEFGDLTDDTRGEWNSSARTEISPILAAGALHNSKYRSVALVHADPIPTLVVSRFIETLITQYSIGLLRIKGLVLTTESPDHPLVVNGAGTMFESPKQLSGWSSVEPATNLIVITKNTDPKPIERLFHSFVGNPQIDTPDFPAISDNPLAIPGT